MVNGQIVAALSGQQAVLVLVLEIAAVCGLRWLRRFVTGQLPRGKEGPQP
jgi:hypothetical protein